MPKKKVEDLTDEQLKRREAFLKERRHNKEPKSKADKNRNTEDLVATDKEKDRRRRRSE